ncbi:hypothetical protein ACUN0G_32425 [Pseudomonas sp. 32A]|uniref:hypothetical protein n=1 Tax=Pseudomonas sp. 32A TaxID=651185 RepID=UPI004046294E
MMEVLRDVRDFIALRNNLVRSIIRYEISDTGTLQLAAIRHVRQGLEKNPKKEVLGQILTAILIAAQGQPRTNLPMLLDKPQIGLHSSGRCHPGRVVDVGSILTA